MAHYHAVLESGRSCEEVFEYLLDFSNAREWDPGVVEGARLDDGPIGVGSKFRLVTRFLGRTAPLVYEVAECERPRLVRFLGENKTVISNDRITFEPLDGTGSRIAYEAELTLKGAWRYLDALLGPAFKPVGDRALAGLRAKLDGEPGQRLS